jgi:hypothetical protein
VSASLGHVDPAKEDDARRRIDAMLTSDKIAAIYSLVP